MVDYTRGETPLELPVRIELTTEDYKSTVLPLNYRSIYRIHYFLDDESNR